MCDSRVPDGVLVVFGLFQWLELLFCPKLGDFDGIDEEFGVLFSGEAFCSVTYMGQSSKNFEIQTSSSLCYLILEFGWQIL